MSTSYQRPGADCTGLGELGLHVHIPRFAYLASSGGPQFGRKMQPQQTEGQTVLRHVQLYAPLGKVTCIMGRSGCGKTTLLRLVAGLQAPHGPATIRFIHSKPAPQTNTQQLFSVSLLSQQESVLPWLTVLDNITYGDRLRGTPPKTDLALTTLEQVGLLQQKSVYSKHLSGGMRQRVALARTLYEDSDLVLLDEPFSALDALTRVEMQTLALQTFFERTVLMITHDPHEAIRLADQLYVLTPSGLQNIALSPKTGTPTRDPMDHRDTLEALLKTLEVDAL